MRDRIVDFVNLPETLRRHARESPQAPAIAMPDAALDYAGLWERVERAGAVLDGNGIRAGDRVAWLGFNHADQIAMLAALMRLSAIFVPLNYRLAAAELRAIVAHAGVRLVFADDAFAALAAELGVPVESTAAIGRASGATQGATPGITQGATQGATQGVQQGATQGARPVERETTADPSVPALLVYTSGTTGRPKGALHTQGGLSCNARMSIDAHRMTASDRILCVLPLFHVGGLCIQTLPGLYAGATVLLHPRFEPGRWLEAVGAQAPTLSLLVPATMRAVIDHPDWASTSLGSLRMLGAGSSTIPDALIAAFHGRGVPVCQIYGATETGPVSIVLSADDAYVRAGAAGRPVAGCAVRLVDADGNDVADGAVGEIWIKAPNVMHGYWRDPSNPAFADGWFHTGDLARRDAAGFYTIAGRAQDLIISGGENIHPAEIENLLLSRPEIAEAAVVGMPDPQWGETPVAVIVVREGATFDEAALRADLAARLARFKQPRRIVVRPALPRNALGKVQKQQLIEALRSAT